VLLNIRADFLCFTLKSVEVPTGCATSHPL
jgi:hypothetical protein